MGRKLLRKCEIGDYVNNWQHLLSTVVRNKQRNNVKGKLKFCAPVPAARVSRDALTATGFTEINHPPHSLVLQN
ncbi:hypothetical protein evm_010901 [Chilo suppressalis]|nr:hypothetical protein evm_010901 [Chilo suppressalis]